MPVVVDFQHAGIGGIGHIESSLFVGAYAQRAGKVALRVAVPGLKKRSVRKKNMDRALLGIADIDRSARVHRDARGVAQARVLKGKQGSALGLKFVNESGSRIGKEN